MKDKRKLTLGVLGLLIIVCTLVSVSYAWYIFNVGEQLDLSTNVNIPACASVSLTNGTALNISGDLAAPISDKKALSSDSYRYEFTVSNMCSVVSNLKIALAPNALSTMPEDAIKYALVEQGASVPNKGQFLVESTKKLLTSQIVDEVYAQTNSSIAMGYEILNSQLASGETKHYYLYVWIDYYEGDKTQSGLNDNVTMNKIFGAHLVVSDYSSSEGGDLIYLKDIILRDNIAYADNVPSLYVTGENGIDFYSPSSSSNGRGLYYTSENTIDGDVSYYFRGDVKNNYVKFGKKENPTCVYNGVKVESIYEKYIDPSTGMEAPPAADAIATKEQCEEMPVCRVGYTYIITDADWCTSEIFGGSVMSGNATWDDEYIWKIIRINEDGSIRLMYSDSNSDFPLAIGQSVFNDASGSNDNAYLGYMYGLPETDKRYGDVDEDGDVDVFDMIALSKVVAGASLTEGVKKYGDLDFNDIINQNDLELWSQLNIGAITAEDLLSDLTDEERYNLTHKNLNDSTVKIMIDNWYKNNLLGYEDYLADAGFCNDRSVDKSKYTGLGYGLNSTLYSASNRLATGTPQFKCNQKNDLFTVNNIIGNKALTYPIGMLTADEVMYSGVGYYDESVSVSSWGDSYLIDMYHWTMTPDAMYKDENYDNVYHDTIWYNTAGGPLSTVYRGDPSLVRPVINLKATVEVAEGNGTQTNPYVIDIDTRTSLVGAILRDNTAYADNKPSEYVTGANGIDFSQPSSDTNGKGLYYTSTNTEGNAPTYYFRGDVQNNYVKFGESLNSFTCTYNGQVVTQALPTGDEYVLDFADIDNADLCNLSVFNIGSDQSPTYVVDPNGYVSGFLQETPVADHGEWVPDKYVWRIVRINEDGSVRLIYNGTSTEAAGPGAAIGDSSFNAKENDNAYAGYMYGTLGSNAYELTHANTNNSTIKTYIENWYSTQTNLSTYLNTHLVDSGFCNDRSVQSGTGAGNAYTNYASDNRILGNNKPQFACPNSDTDLFTTRSSSKGNKALTIPIGLITADEVAYAGYAINSSNYLYTGTDYWTMTPYGGGSAMLWLVTADWGLDYVAYFASGAYGVRPVINLKGNLKVTGLGTATDPYVIAD